MLSMGNISYVAFYCSQRFQIFLTKALVQMCVSTNVTIGTSYSAVRCIGKQEKQEHFFITGVEMLAPSVTQKPEGGSNC